MTRRRQQTPNPEEPRQGVSPPEKEELAANIDQVGEWFTKTVEREQEEQEGRPKAFEPGEEGVEQPLGE